MLVDAHVHLGRFMTIDREIDAETAVREAETQGIDKIFITHVKSLYYDYRMGNEEVYEAMKKYPDRVMGYVSIPSPRHGPEMIDYIQNCVFRRGFHGLKVYSHPKGVYSADPLLSVADGYFAPIYELAAEWQIPVLAHAASFEMEAVCGNFPNLVMILAHMGGTPISGGDWHTAIDTARRHPNLILDCTGSTVDFGMIEEAVRVIGPERVIWGSDEPMLDRWLNLDRIRGAEISEAEKELILGHNIMCMVEKGRRTVDGIKAARNL